MPIGVLSVPKLAKLAVNAALRQYVQDRLAGSVTKLDGTLLAGPDVRWIGRRHGRRQDRRWAASWSPEQIAHRLQLDFPDDPSMRISHEAIYQALLRLPSVAVGRAPRLGRQRVDRLRADVSHGDNLQVQIGAQPSVPTR